MLLFYVRHGDPTYSPDELTPLGKRQAEAVAKRLALYGVDKIYVSPKQRTIETAKPTCELLKKDMIQLDFCSEEYTWEELSATKENGVRVWAYTKPEIRELFLSRELREMGRQWYDHPALEQYSIKKGILRVQQETDKFLCSLGYEHIPDTGAYKVVQQNNDRVALFAHHGFGLAFLSCLLDIDYPQICLHFDMAHTGMTVIDFKESGGIVIPKVLTLSSDAHLYREGMPTGYWRQVRF